MPRLSPPLIQGTGKDGSFAGAVYITDGQLITYRWIPNPKTLEEVRVKLRQPGSPTRSKAPTTSRPSAYSSDPRPQAADIGRHLPPISAGGLRP